MIKKQKNKIIAIACAVLVLAVGYAVLANTLFKPTEAPPVTKDLSLFEKIEKANVQRIEVKNEKGGYVVYRGVDGELYFEGAESQIYDSYLLSSLISAAGNPVANQTVDNYSAEDLSVYGLGNGSYRAMFTVSTVSDPSVSHTVRIGNQLVNGAGYYAMVDGKDVLYVLSQFYSTSLFADIKDFFAPRVAIPAVTEDGGVATVDRFTVYKNGEKLLNIRPSATESEESLVTHTLYAYQMDYPQVSWISNSEFSTVLKTLQDFVGVGVAEYGINTKVEALQEFLKSTDAIGADTEQAKLAYEAMTMFQTYGLLNKDFQFPVVLDYQVGEIRSYVIVSLPNEDGKFFVYSQAFDLIAEFEQEGFEWIFWEAEDYCVKSLFNHSVYDLTQVAIVAPEVSATFDVTVKSDKKEIERVVDAVSGKEVNGDLFKQLYRGFLYFSTLGPAEKPTEAKPSLTVKISVADGSQTEFVFYDLSDRKSYYTVNGQGGSYVNRDNVKALITYTQNLLEGKSFTSSLL